MGRRESQPSPVPDRAGPLAGSAGWRLGRVKLGAQTLWWSWPKRRDQRITPYRNLLTALCAYPDSTLNAHPIFTSNPSF